VTRSPRGGAAR